MEQPYVKLNIDNNNIGRIQFFHPSSNALPSGLLKKLKETIEEAGANPQIKVILLESEGKTFCAGASFNELMQLKNHAQAVEFFNGFARLINSMKQIPKLIVTKVQGKTVGGGLGIIAASDYVLAHEKAAIKLSELSLGIGPYVISPAIKRKIGVAAFSELSINATQWHNAYWAKNKGLYAQVWDSDSKLEEETELFLEKLSSFDQTAMKKLKEEIWEGTDHWEELLAQKAEISASLVLQEFTQEKIKQFKNK